MVGYWKLLELLESLGGEAIIAECVLEWRYWRTHIGELIFESKQQELFLHIGQQSWFMFLSPWLFGSILGSSKMWD